MISKYLNAGFILKYVKWEPPKPNDNTGPVKIADKHNFDTLVTNSGRDAFIMFYKPTCPHCIKLMPDWDDLGKKMENEVVDIMKIDAIANPSPRPYVVNSFPTIYMKFESNLRSPMKYTGERSVKHFIKFICKNATHEPNEWNRMGKPKKLKIT